MLFHSIQGAGGFSVAAPTSPTFVSYDIFATTSGVTSLTVNAPTNISAGNLLLAVVNLNAGAARTLTAPTGWTVVTTTSNRFFAHAVATSSEPSSYTFNLSGSAAGTVAVMNFSSAAIDVFGSTSAASTNPTAPSITLTENNSLVLCVVTANTSSNSVSVTGFTEIYERTAGSAQDVSSKSFNSGATGTVATTATASGSRASLVGLKPN